MKARALNIVLLGHRGGGSGAFYDEGDCSKIWTLSPGHRKSARYIALKYGNPHPTIGWFDYEHGASLRFFSNEK